MILVESLNTREIAIVLWGFVFFVWALTIRSVRTSMLGVVKAFLHKKVLLVFGAMLAYVWLVVLAFYRIGFWDLSALKDTCLWVGGVAFVMIMNFYEAGKNEAFFRQQVINGLKFTVLMEFVVNLYTFPLAVELVFVPFAALLGGLMAVSETKSEYKSVKTILEWTAGLVGLAIIGLTINQIVDGFEGFATIRNLRDFLLPFLLTLVYLPFVYFVAVFASYEGMYVRLKFKTPTLATYSIWRILIAVGLDLKEVHEFSRYLGLPHIETKKDVGTIIERYKNQPDGTGKDH